MLKRWGRKTVFVFSCAVFFCLAGRVGAHMGITPFKVVEDMKKAGTGPYSVKKPIPGKVGPSAIKNGVTQKILKNVKGIGPGRIFKNMREQKTGPFIFSRENMKKTKALRFGDSAKDKPVLPNIPDNNEPPTPIL